MERNFSQECIVCERPLEGVSIFSTIHHEGSDIHLCCPLCADVFMEKKNFYTVKREALEAGQRLKNKPKTNDE